MVNPFCNLLSNGYSFSVDRASDTLQVRPCCHFKEKIPVTNDIKNVRRAKFDIVNDWTPNCQNCQILESSGQQSLRQTGPDWIPNDVPDQAAVMIDINLDKECNAACVICDEQSSTLWAKENNKILGIRQKISRSDLTVDRHINTITKTISLEHVKYVKFYGGEPLFTDTHIKFLNTVPDPSAVTVHYTTNGSIFPNDLVLEQWSKFKTIIFAASLDGVDEQFDYVRWPLPWAKVSRNLVKLKQARLHNVMFRVEFTANLLNTFYYDRLDSWIRTYLDTNEFGDRTEVNLHHCTGSAFDLKYMPMPLRRSIMQKYPQNHILHKMIADLPAPAPLDDFWNFVCQWDPRRNLRWEHCFPDLVPLMQQ